MTSLQTLVVLHQPLDTAPAAYEPLRGAWTIVTCQRRVAVALAHLNDAAGALHGEAAYRLLLELVSGLHSPVAGETNVAGQFRRAWQEFCIDPESRAPARALAPIVDRLFSDAALIRQRWLQGLGGRSYGTLARKLLRPRVGDHVLVVGAGDLARSILPAFAAWNPEQYARRPGEPRTRFHGGDERAAITWADCVVFCTPFGEDFRSRWYPSIVARPEVRVLHLGARDADQPGTLTLDTLFALSSELDTVRAGKIAAARDACGVMARERAYIVASGRTASYL